MIPDPAIQAVQNSFVLLDHKQPRSLLGSDAEMFRNGGVEVAFLGTVRGIVGPDRRIAIDFTYADNPDLVRHGFRFEPEKAHQDAFAFAI